MKNVIIFFQKQLCIKSYCCADHIESEEHGFRGAIRRTCAACGQLQGAKVEWSLLFAIIALVTLIIRS